MTPSYTSGMAWWRHQMETLFALLAICARNSPVNGEFPAQRPVTRSFDVFFDLRLNKRLSKHSWGWWFETLSRPLWRHCNGLLQIILKKLLDWSQKNICDQEWYTSKITLNHCETHGAINIIGSLSNNYLIWIFPESSNVQISMSQ